MEQSWLAIGASAFLTGGVTMGMVAWLLASARARGIAHAALREVETRAAVAGARAEALGEQAQQAEGRANGLEAALRQVDSQRAAERERAEGLSRSLDEQRDLLEAAKVQLGDTFQALAGEALRASQEDFLALATERLGAVRKETSAELEFRQQAQQKVLEGMVGPVRASLEKVDEQVRAMERERGTAYGALRQQMQSISETQEKLRDATGNLVSALKTPSVRGRWGEMQLRRVVELAGMLEHCDFEQQVTANGEDGRLRPDMVVRLPGGRNIVVDAKAPLGAYLEALETADPGARTAKLRHHAAQVQAHIRKLSSKSYWEGFAGSTEFVVMFLPGESFYDVALEQMPGLIEDGVAQRVLIATPTTLLGLLLTTSCGWREERLADNAQRISDEGRNLHGRIATVLEYLGELGGSLNQSVKHFNQALSSFNGRVTVSARRLEALDARGKKDLVEIDEIDVRAASGSPPERRARGRQLPQPTLTLPLSPTLPLSSALALSPTNDEGG
ncbi:MAG TPA: DNA recombination protein RmuC [Polyangia bacterium]|nr:DNA recombination protein RmuC [Polyangia bacterium]